MTKNQKIYLGDGVYLFYDGYHYVLTTENGIETSNVIYLEPAVVLAFYKMTKASNPSYTLLEKANNSINFSRNWLKNLSLKYGFNFEDSGTLKQISEEIEDFLDSVK